METKVYTPEEAESQKLSLRNNQNLFYENKTSTSLGDAHLFSLFGFCEGETHVFMEKSGRVFDFVFDYAVDPVMRVDESNIVFHCFNSLVSK